MRTYMSHDLGHNMSTCSQKLQCSKLYKMSSDYIVFNLNLKTDH